MWVVCVREAGFVPSTRLQINHEVRGSTFEKAGTWDTSLTLSGVIRCSASLSSSQVSTDYLRIGCSCSRDLDDFVKTEDSCQEDTCEVSGYIYDRWLRDTSLNIASPTFLSTKQLRRGPGPGTILSKTWLLVVKINILELEDTEYVARSCQFWIQDQHAPHRIYSAHFSRAYFKDE